MYIPRCWAVIQPFLCSLYMPKCENGLVDLPSFVRIFLIFFKFYSSKLIKDEKNFSANNIECKCIQNYFRKCVK